VNTRQSIIGFRTFLLRLEETCLIVMMSFLLALVFGEVVLRYLHLPLFWTEELTRYLFIWIIMIGSIVAVDKKAHFNVELVVNYFPEPLRKLVSILENALTILFLILLGYKGIGAYHSMSGVTTPSLSLPQFIPFSIIPVAAFFMLLHLVLSFLGSRVTREKE
jgi:TRAP-type C4-dicarboxylate transport system permease small subunit